MSKLKTFVAVLMLIFVLGLAAPQALAGDMNEPPGETNAPPGITGELNTPPAPAPGDTPGTGFASWAKIFFQILGNSWSV